GQDRLAQAPRSRAGCGFAGGGTGDRAGDRPHAAPAADRSRHRRDSPCQRDDVSAGGGLAFSNDSILEMKVGAMADFGGTDTVVATQSLTQSAQEKLRQLVARIERLE